MAGELFLGIEGGATRTTGVLADARMHVVARHAAGPSNIHSVGVDAAVGALSDVVGELLLASGGWARVAASAFCLAGLRGAADEALWRWVVEEMGVRSFVLLTHDAAATLAAGSPDGTGLLVLSGTGSLVYGRRADGQERFAIGRGPALGDDGSGFDIGWRGLRAVARSADGRGPTTLLARRVVERLGLESLDELVAHVGPFAKDRIAEVAPIVFDAADAGDRVAKEIVCAAAAELVAGAQAVVRGLWPRRGAGPRRVVFAGGVLRHRPSFRSLVASQLSALTPDAKGIVPRVDGAVGAARLARGWLRDKEGTRR